MRQKLLHERFSLPVWCRMMSAWRLPAPVCSAFVYHIHLDFLRMRGTVRPRDPRILCVHSLSDPFREVIGLRCYNGIVWAIAWDPNKSIDVGEWWICGGGRLERFYCIPLASVTNYIPTYPDNTLHFCYQTPPTEKYITTLTQTDHCQVVSNTDSPMVYKFQTTSDS